MVVIPFWLRAPRGFIARWVWIGCWLLAGVAQAQAPSPFAAFTGPANEVRTEQVHARLIAQAPQGVGPGKPLWLGLELTHAPHWHSYWLNPGDSGQATQLQWQLPPGWQAQAVQWPTPVRLPVPPLANYGYDGTVLLASPVQVPANAASGAQRVALQAQWLVCRQECLPQQGRFVLDLPADGAPITADAAVFDAARAAVPRPLDGSIEARVDAAQQRVTFATDALPAAWRGKPVNLYPETPEITVPAASGEQRWDGARWQITLPLNPQRSDSPAQLPVVLALRDAAADPDGVQRNQHGQTSWRAEAAVHGTWPAGQSRAELPPALAATLAAQASAPARPALGAGLAAGTRDGAAGGAQSSFWLALGGALLGGLLLNLMPCVFPVLAIKVLGFARHAHRPSDLRLSGLAYTAGVLLSLLALAALLLALRAAGQQLGWGFQLQNPYLVAALAALFTLLALNLAGAFEVGHVLPARWMQATARHPAADALLSGLLAVLIASPCSAPFLGASLGLAVDRPAWQACAIFAAMGLGLALPVLAASCAPALLRWLPRPGAWMARFRTLMAFPMLGTVVWLVWVLGQQAGIDGAAVLLALLVVGSALVWALGQRGSAVRWPVAVLCTAMLVWIGKGYGALLAPLPAAPQAAAAASSPASDGWQPWSEQRVAQALAAGQPVFVDYTAAWCVTCQVNKQRVLHTDAFAQLARAHHLLLLRADWTRPDPAITASLAQLGRSGVPVYVLYRPQAPAQPVVLGEVLSLDAVQAALQAS